MRARRSCRRCACAPRAAPTVRAPVSILALRRSMPRPGSPTSSTQPTRVLLLDLRAQLAPRILVGRERQPPHRRARQRHERRTAWRPRAPARTPPPRSTSPSAGASSFVGRSGQGGRQPTERGAGADRRPRTPRASRGSRRRRLHAQGSVDEHRRRPVRGQRRRRGGRCAARRSPRPRRPRACRTRQTPPATTGPREPARRCGRGLAAGRLAPTARPPGCGRRWPRRAARASSPARAAARRRAPLASASRLTRGSASPPARDDGAPPAADAVRRARRARCAPTTTSENSANASRSARLPPASPGKCQATTGAPPRGTADRPAAGPGRRRRCHEAAAGSSAGGQPARRAGRRGLEAAHGAHHAHARSRPWCRRPPRRESSARRPAAPSAAPSAPTSGIDTARASPGPTVTPPTLTPRTGSSTSMSLGGQAVEAGSAGVLTDSRAISARSGCSACAPPRGSEGRSAAPASPPPWPCSGAAGDRRRRRRSARSRSRAARPPRRAGSIRPRRRAAAGCR